MQSQHAQSFPQIIRLRIGPTNHSHFPISLLSSDLYAFSFIIFFNHQRGCFEKTYQHYLRVRFKPQNLHIMRRRGVCRSATWPRHVHQFMHGNGYLCLRPGVFPSGPECSSVPFVCTSPVGGPIQQWAIKDWWGVLLFGPVWFPFIGWKIPILRRHYIITHH